MRAKRLSTGTMKWVVAAAVACAGTVWGQATAPATRAAATRPQVTAPMPLAITPAVPYAAKPLPLHDVRLTGGPLLAAQKLDADYLLTLEPDRMLYHLRLQAGLMPKAQQALGGWDGSGRQLTGHIAGHYLSAVSYMYAATGDARFKERADYLVNELRDIQARHGDGYIGGLLGNAPGRQGGGGGRGRGEPALVSGKTLFAQLSDGNIRTTGFDLNGMWSPWYVQHKLYAGLRDAYRLTGNTTALDVETKFAAWCEKLLAPLNEEQVQRMLNTEFGAMNEVFADLYADTGDKQWYALSDKFTHKAVVVPLANGEDILPGKHGNTQVPKLLGDLMRWVYAGDETSGKAAKFFWERVAFHHSFATGGHGRNEYFGRPDVLVPMLDGRTAETCNVYNMLKFTRTLFAIEPDAKYAEFHERALFNHILAAINPRNSAFAYMVPVGQGVRQEYDNNNGFTCCVGTGMESHALHAHGIYYEAGDSLWVNLFAPSTANWRAQGVTVEQETSFPEGDTATIKVSPDRAKELTIRLRRPGWVKEGSDGFAIKVNGEPVANLGRPASYVELRRTWKPGDVIDVKLPKKLWTSPTPDNPSKMALMWGPLVLAADMSGMVGTGGRGRGGRGADGRTRPGTFPVLVADKAVETWLLPVEGAAAGTFRATGRQLAGVGGEGPAGDVAVTFQPFYRTHNVPYGIYWDVMTTAELEKRSVELAAEQEKRRKLQAATVAFVQPGLMQMERDFHYQAGDESAPVNVADRSGRRAATWMSFDLPVEEARPMALIVTYRNDEPSTRRFALQVDGTTLKDEVVERAGPQEFDFVDREYALPANLVKGKEKVTLRFQAAPGSEVGRVFGVRMIRADAR